MPSKIPEIVKCNSADCLDRELRPVREGLAFQETEETWDKITHSILYLVALLKGGAFDFPVELVSNLKSLSRPLNNAMNSERSRLSGAATDLLAILAMGLAQSFDPLIPHFIPTLLGLATRSNKLFIARAKSCILSIIEHTLLPSLLPHFQRAVTDKSASLRLVATEAVLACLNCFNPPDLEPTTRAEDIEAVIRCTARDASADVRRGSRMIFEAYKILLPGRVDAFVGPLTPIMKKYLDIKSANSFQTKYASSSSANLVSVMSSSTSAVPSTATVLSTSSINRPHGHGRSTSSTVLEVGTTIRRKERFENRETVQDGKAQAMRGADGKGGPRREMPPPATMPVRARSPKRNVVSVVAETIDMTHERHRVVSNPSSNRSKAASRPPSRPDLNSATQPTSTSQFNGPLNNPISSNSSEEERAGRARRVISHAGPSNIHPQDVVEVACTIGMGSTRPQSPGRSTTLPNRLLSAPYNGPSRLIAAMAGQSDRDAKRVKAAPSGKERVIGGARRVPKPVTLDVKIHDTKLGEIVQDKPKPTRKNNILLQSSASNKALATLPNSVVESSNLKIQAGLCTAGVLSSKSSLKSRTTTKPGFAPRRNPATSGGLTAPTLSQLAKMKTLVKPVASGSAAGSSLGKHAKPGWGHSAPSARHTIKPLCVSKKGRTATSQGITGDSKGDSTAIIPESIPLPSSPSLHATTVVTATHADELMEGSAVEKHDTVIHGVKVAVCNQPILQINPAEIPLPLAPDADVLGESQGEQLADIIYLGDHSSSPVHHLSPASDIGQVATPISSLVTSIQRGFLFTPAAEISSPNTTIPFPDMGSEEALSEDEMYGIEFHVDGVDASGQVIESPRKVANAHRYGDTDINGRYVFAEVNV